jgi:DNA mismatch repair protein MutS2
MISHLDAVAKLEFDKVKKHAARYAVSDIGRELIDNLSPSSALSAIRLALAQVTEMKDLLNGDDAPPLDGIPDIRIALQRSTIENYALAPEELRQIFALLFTTRQLAAYFSRRRQRYVLLAELVTGLAPDKILEYNIDQAIDERGAVKDGASKELRTIRRSIVEKQGALRSNLETMLRSISDKEWTQEEIITTRDGRMVIPVKTEYKNRVPGFIHSTSSSGATVFVEPTESLDLNNEIRTLQFQEQREIERLLKDLTGQVSESRDRLAENLRILTAVDSLQARAKYSIEILGSEPAIVAEGLLNLREAYHPILLQRHKRSEVVPLSFALSEGFRIVIISGPNAGGKSVAMKTIGLMPILAQSGFHIPASPESQLPVFDDIFVDMGDEQSIENDLSSFTSHLKNIKFVLENAGPRSLVLLDEIAAGTDPVEGASIAAAVLEELRRVNAVVVVTTHHGALKSFAHESAGFANAAMEFDQETLSPSYRLRLGVPGSSYAIEIAERMGLARTVIERSRQILGDAGSKLERLLIDLERQAQAHTAALKHLEASQLRVDELNRLYTSKTSHLDKELKARRTQALQEADEILRSANALVEKTIREIRESAASPAVIQEIRHEVEARRAEMESNLTQLRPEPVPETGLSVGDTVQLLESDIVGTVESVSGPGRYVIATANARLKARQKDLKKVEAPKVTIAAAKENTIESQATSEIDLRGLYGDEAITAIEKFFDTAILSGLHTVRLIHGKGTGALRKRVSEYLQQRHDVKSFRLGEWNEGGSGVTVVELE